MMDNTKSWNMKTKALETLPKILSFLFLDDDQCSLVDMLQWHSRPVVCSDIRNQRGYLLPT